ncbi:MAG: nuclear transport factor 2 family protein [Candidatus Wenzhouxiangella sp. M2_3B_020]
MMRAIWTLSAVVLAWVPALAQVEGGECHRGPTVDALETRRATFNDAIRDADLAAIGNVLAADVVLVAGTHSDRFLDRSSQLEIWRDDFGNGPDRFVYVRTPSCIRLSSIGPMAMERGRWRGEDPSGNSASGTYSAKWRRIDDQWRLETETFMTEQCDGTGCPDSSD